MKITLVRHGETYRNREGKFRGHVDTELSDLKRAHATAKAIALYHPDISFHEDQRSIEILPI
jgi:broad specificity phosphatase PhoE